MPTSRTNQVGCYGCITLPIRKALCDKLIEQIDLKLQTSSIVDSAKEYQRG